MVLDGGSCSVRLLQTGLHQWSDGTAGRTDHAALYRWVLVHGCVPRLSGSSVRGASCATAQHGDPKETRIPIGCLLKLREGAWMICGKNSRGHLLTSRLTPKGM